MGRLVRFLAGDPIRDLTVGFSEARAAIRAASGSAFHVDIALRQPVRWRSEACHQRFDFRRDLRFADEQKRSIVQKKFAAEPLSARTELDLISPEAFGIERQVHTAVRPTLAFLKFSEQLPITVHVSLSVVFKDGKLPPEVLQG